MTGSTRQLTRNHQVEQINNGAAAAGLIVELGDLLRTGRIDESEFVTAVVGADLLTHQAAVGLADRYVTNLRTLVAPDEDHADPVAVEFDPGPSVGRAVHTLRELEEARRAPERDWGAAFSRIISALAVQSDRAAKDAGRETVVESAEANGRRWRRVTDGNPCSFCAMLAGRGPVYRTEDSATRVAGRNNYGTAAYKAGNVTYGGKITRGKLKGQDRTRGSRGLGERYHDFCGCSVEEALVDWEPTPQEREYVDLYERAAEACDAEGLPRTGTNVASKMRELGQGIVNDARKVDATTAAPKAVDLTKLSMQDLEARMMAAAEAGDWLESERIGEILDNGFYGPSGMPIDKDNPFQADVYDAFEGLDEDAQFAYLDALGERADLFSQAQWEHVSNRSARTVPTEREQRAQYEQYLEVQFVAAENATNGFMLTAEAKAAGHRPRDLWKVNEATARKWATPEMLEFWDSNGRFTWTDWRQQFEGDMGANMKRSGTWLR